MSTSATEVLQAAIRQRWPREPSGKTERYLGQFFAATRTGTKITAKVEGNHGVYTVSIGVEEGLRASCSCYIGAGGTCHHCEALARTFLNNPGRFKEVKQPELAEVQTLADLQVYLKNTTLDAMLAQLKANGITQKAFAGSIGMSTRHLSAVRASELKNRYFHELGATKLACLWVLEHMKQGTP